MSRKIAKDLGCHYWKDFFSSGMGNPWRVAPNPKMLKSFYITQLKNRFSYPVLFDAEYVTAWKIQHQNLVDVILLSEKQTE